MLRLSPINLVHSPALMTIVTDMSQASSQASYHANRQEQASRRSS